MITSKIFLPEERISRVESNENKKVEKTEGKGARKKKGTVQQKESKFGLCACTKVKYCTFLHLYPNVAAV